MLTTRDGLAVMIDAKASISRKPRFLLLLGDPHRNIAITSDMEKPESCS